MIDPAAEQSTRYERDLTTGLVGKYLQVAQVLLPRSRVLDLGGSSGYFSRWLVDAGHSVVLLDSDRESVAAAHSRGIDARVADLNSSVWSNSVGERFDAILMMDVLEHVTDPQATLHQARSLLSPEGRLLITGPNVAYWWMRLNLLRGRWDYADAGIMDRTHLWWFTFSTWRTLVEKAGYDVMKIEACEGMLPKEQWLTRLLGIPRVDRLRASLVSRMPSIFGTVFLIVAQARSEA